MGAGKGWLSAHCHTGDVAGVTTGWPKAADVSVPLLATGGRAGTVAAGGAGCCGVSGKGTVLQAASVPTIMAVRMLRKRMRGHILFSAMTLLYLEALGALLLLVFIVWWTMFSGRKKGELPDDVEREKARNATAQNTQAASHDKDKP